DYGGAAPPGCGKTPSPRHPGRRSGPPDGSPGSRRPRTPAPSSVHHLAAGGCAVPGPEGAGGGPAAGKDTVGEGRTAHVETRGHTHGGAPGGVQALDPAPVPVDDIAGVLVDPKPPHGNGRQWIAGIAHGNVQGVIGSLGQGAQVIANLAELGVLALLRVGVVAGQGGGQARRIDAAFFSEALDGGRLAGAAQQVVQLVGGPGILEKGNALGGQGALEGLPVKGPVDDQPALATGLL